MTMNKRSKARKRNKPTKTQPQPTRHRHINLMQHNHQLPPSPIRQPPQRNRPHHRTQHAHKHNQPRAARQLLLHRIDLTQPLGDMLAELDEGGVALEIVVVAMHRLQRAHRGDLLDEVLGLIDENEGAAQDGDEAVARGDGGEGG
ncbi:hypothetical protein BU16DRAFT_191274 [Lophium mytilinum]|uniref:Uncharacterized protein n=1 Tax=Lophium mytilinum TaxID=390894 RepID=A0A6A6R9D7_9PEZI|nr:hypothetical protein BU16DRAFT_191274 [Lophium mytilinum]